MHTFAHTPTPPPPLVGREREQVALHAALSIAIGGAGSLVLIGGEAGIGKTALAEAICREATEQDALVLVGRCYDLTETPPYGPWAEALARAPAIAELPSLPAALLPHERDGERLAGQDAILRRVWDYLAALAATRPVVLLLDDLHWADPATLDLLRVVGRGLADVPILLLATYRTEEVGRGHPLAALLPLLVREARAARLDLRPLDAGAIVALVAARYALADADAVRLVSYLSGRSEGNALFLGELLRTLEGAGVVREAGDRWVLGELEAVPVPPLLRQVIEGRLRHLGPGTERLLTVGAVVGQEVPLAVWAAVAAVDEDALVVAIERAVAARLLEAQGDGTGVRFAHALIREVLYEGIMPMQRRVWHRRVGDAVAASLHPDPDAVAAHYQRAGDDRAVPWLIRAGERAAASYAHFTAAARVEAALALLDARGGDEAERGWLCTYLAYWRRADDPRRALAYVERAVVLAAVSDDPALAAWSLYVLGVLRCFNSHLRDGLVAMAAGVAARETLTPEEQTRLIARQAAIGEPMSPYHGWNNLAVWLEAPGRNIEAAALAERLLPATTDARRAGWGHTYHALGVTAANLGRPAESAQWYAEAKVGARTDGNHWLVGQYTFYELLALHLPYRADHPYERERLVAEAAAAWEQSSGIIRAEMAMPLARLPLMVLAGEWDEAREVALAVRASGTMQVSNVRSLLGPLALARGEADLARQLVREILPDGPATEPGDSWFRPAVILQRVAAHLALDAGDRTLAREWLDAHDRWIAWSGTVPGRAEGQLGWATYHRATGDHAAAHRHTEAALILASEPRQPLALLAAHRLLGELHTDGERFDAAREHLAIALALADACAAPYERALTLLALAALCGATNDRAAAMALLDEARAICIPLHAAPTLARADALAARLAAMPPPAPVFPDGLSAREVDVLRLIAGGSTNQEIAATLCLSVRTVERHITGLYRKIDGRGRADATTYALRHALVPDPPSS